MHNLQEALSKNQSLWSDNDKQIVEQFFLSNSFFSKFYQNKKLSQIARTCRYCRMETGQKLSLQNNNRAQAIVLLSGECVIKKKQTKLRKKAKPSTDDKQQRTQKGQKWYQQSPSRFQQQFEYTFLALLTQFNQTLTLNSECIIQIPHKNSAQIIFIPCVLYYKLEEQIEHDRVQKIQKVLEKFFFRLKKKEVRQLSQNNCCFREFKMNNYIYRASSKPEEVYLLLQGMVKLQKPGFSQQTLKENILLNPGMIFGDKDLKLDERSKNAVACTAHVEVLTIPKIPFLRYALKAFPQMLFDEEKLSPSRLPKVDQSLRLSHSLKVSVTKNFLLPFIRRSHFHESSLNAQNKKSESQQKRQYDLIRNSHVLLDMNVKKERKFELRKFSPKKKQEMEQLLKNQKSKLKQLKLESRFSLNNSLLNL